MTNKMPIDKNMLELMRLAHKDLPRLTEQDVISIYELLTSEDAEVKMTGVAILDTFNYFVTPETIYRLYDNTSITDELDENDIFAGMVRLIYADSDRYRKETSENDKINDKHLAELICKN